MALVPNRRISASLTAARQCYPVTLPAGLVSRINLDQAFGDLVSDVYSPSGALVLHLDSFEFGIETATLTPAVSGRFRACVSAAATTVEPTRYTLWLDAPRAPLPEDELRAKAYRAASDAKRLAASGVSADLRRAIETDRKALELFESLGDASAQARTLIRIGESLEALSEYAAAREEYARAMAICPAGETRAFAQALSNSGFAAYRLGDPETARDALERGLVMFQKLGLPLPIAAVRNNLGLLWLRTGEFQQALDSLLAALPVMHRMAPVYEGRVLSNIALA